MSNMQRLFAVTLVLGVLVGGAAAQEPPPPAEEPEAVQKADDESDEAPAEPRRQIRVLQNPYDLASFYRSSQAGTVYFGEQGGSDPRYPIAGFYRQRPSVNPYGYASFWSAGYGSRDRGRGQVVVGYRRSIGENGDLFLFAPTFLSPVGPLTGVFFGDR
jgi:hypothetical protein